MSGKAEDNGTVVPQFMSELEWVWVFTNAITKHRDSIFVLDMNEKDDGGRRRVVPAFESREDAVKIKDRLIPEKTEAYTEQAIQLSEIGKFAAKNELEIMLLDGRGTIIAHMEAKIEQMSVH